MGAVRGTVRDALRKFRDLDHDAVLLLASALWGRPAPGVLPVFERRLAAVVLLQTRVRTLLHSDLTRLEGFLRSAATGELADPLLADVVAPMLAGLGDRGTAASRGGPGPGGGPIRTAELRDAAAYLDQAVPGAPAR